MDQSMEWSAKAPGTAHQPTTKKSSAEEIIEDRGAAGGNEPAENIPGEVISTEEEIPDKSTTKIGKSVEKKIVDKTTAKCEKSAEDDKSAKKSSAEESVDSSSAVADKEIEEVTAAMIERKMTEEIEETIVVNYSKVNPILCFIKK